MYLTLFHRKQGIQKVMQTSNVNLKGIADTALRNWIKGVETGAWREYLDLLTEDYTFLVPSSGYSTLGLDFEKNQEEKQKAAFQKMRRMAYSKQPDRTSTGGTTVVYEFIVESPVDQNLHCLALSFDVLGNKISACREYHCVLMQY